MSATDGGPGMEPGAVPVDPDSRAGTPASGDTGQPGRGEAQARAEEIHADVARTDARRAEEQAARADQAVEEAERRQKDAHEAEERARRHAEEARADAEGAAQDVSRTSTTTATRTSAAGDGGDPIVFGPFTAERPELLVAAAFVGGFLLAKIIRGMAS